MKNQSCTAEVEVSGEVVSAFMAAFPQGTEPLGLAVLEGHGIRAPAPEKWYPLQSFLDAVKELELRISPEMLRRVGEQIAKRAKLPADGKHLEDVLPAVDKAFQRNYRGGEIGHYEFRNEGFSAGLHSIKVICENPYPCVLDQGAIEGLTKRFKPRGCLDVVVRHEDSQPCRRHGDDSCTYSVSWG